MNKVLLVKWLIRIKDPSITGWWKTIILCKYPNLASSSNLSPFMKGIVKYKDILEISIDWKVGNSQAVAFWSNR
jgi:hypothetical protein